MNRFALAFVLLTAACGGSKSSGSSSSICDGPSAPAICNMACDPASGTGDAVCGAGYHCASTGKCDAQCTATGGECGAGYVCTNDGFCTMDDGGGGGDDTPPVDAECPSLQFTVTRVIPSIEILLDRSGSMKNDFAGNNRSTPPNEDPPEKFYTEQQALVGSSGIVTQLEDSVYFGTSMFPGDTCPSPLYSTPRKLGNAAAIANLIANHRPDGGITPTADAINSVVADFAASPPPANSPPIIVLATDGIPNPCTSSNGKLDAINAAKNAFNKGIKMYLLIVGIDKDLDADPQFKQVLANAGQGVTSGAVVYSATNPAEMSAAFQQIIGGVVSCDLKLNGMVQADYANTGIVVLNGKTLTYMTDWTLDANGMGIHLSDAKCQELKTTPNPSVSATFACGAGVIFQ